MTGQAPDGGVLGEDVPGEKLGRDRIFPRRGDRGAGTMLTLGVCLALASVMLAATMVISWFAQARAGEQAAELAALAGAGAAVEGRPPCEAAARVAAANDSTLTLCRVRGTAPDVVVVVEVTAELWPAPWPGMPGSIVRQATAGTA